MDTSGRKKWHERFLLERFFEAAAIDAEITEDREVPDFIVRVQGRTVGVELTEIFISHDASSPMQAQESISTRIVASAQKQYQSCGAPPATVTVCFGPGQDLRKLNRDEVARALALFVRELNLSDGQLVNWSPQELVGPLPHQISFVHALGVPTFTMAHWRVARAGWVAPLVADSLQLRINEKAMRLSSYQDTVPENWLVVVANALKPSQLVEVREDFDPDSISSPFRRTFFYGHPDRAVIEVGRGAVK
jgi:hypothetical protein